MFFLQFDIICHFQCYNPSVKSSSGVGSVFLHLFFHPEHVQLISLRNSFIAVTLHKKLTVHTEVKNLFKRGFITV